MAQKIHLLAVVLRRVLAFLLMYALTSLKRILSLCSCFLVVLYLSVEQCSTDVNAASV